MTTYRYSTGCTTNVPNESWQAGEWSWRPWERSRRWHLTILDIFFLQKKKKRERSSVSMSKTGKVWSATSLVWWPLTWCSNPKCFLATVTLNERTFFSTVAQLGLKYQSPSHNSKPPAGRRSDYQNSQSRQILVSQLIWGAGTVFVQWSSVPSNSNSRGEAGMIGIVQDYKTMRGFCFFFGHAQLRCYMCETDLATTVFMKGHRSSFLPERGFGAWSSRRGSFKPLPNARNVKGKQQVTQIAPISRDSYCTTTKSATGANRSVAGSSVLLSVPANMRWCSNLTVS